MLRRQPERILINSLSANTVIGDASGVLNEGYGEILLADVINSYCDCPSPCVAQITTVLITIPDSCECPYEWPLTIRCKPRLQSYEVQQTFGSTKYYGYSDPAGGVPTADTAGPAIAAAINADPTACVTATYDAGTDTLTLTEKDCSQTAGFDAFTESGTVTLDTAHVEEVLSADYMHKLFPIKVGVFGSNPNLPSCGDYCVWHFVIRKSCDAQDISAANHYNCYEQEVYFYVNKNDANYEAYWVTEMNAAGLGNCVS